MASGSTGLDGGPLGNVPEAGQAPLGMFASSGVSLADTGMVVRGYDRSVVLYERGMVAGRFGTIVGSDAGRRCPS